MANGLGRWMDGMQGGMGHQGHIAARVKLIEVQIEGFKVCMCMGESRAVSQNHYFNIQWEVTIRTCWDQGVFG